MKTVWVNGCFDILHPGHMRLLRTARDIAGDDKFVVVGIDSDERVRTMKGTDRPINDENYRSEMLLSTSFVDKVIIFDTSEALLRILQCLKPSKMVIGSEYRDKHIVGSDYIREILYMNTDDRYSTTKIINKIKGVT